MTILLHHLTLCVHVFAALQSSAPVLPCRSAARLSCSRKLRHFPKHTRLLAYRHNPCPQAGPSREPQAPRKDGKRAHRPCTLFALSLLCPLQVEFKSATGRLSAPQRAWHKRQQEQGFTVVVVRTVAAFLKALEQHVGNCERELLSSVPVINTDGAHAPAPEQ